MRGVQRVHGSLPGLGRGTKICRSLLLAALLTGVVGGCAEPPDPAGPHGQGIDPVRQAPEIGGLNWDGRPFRLSELRGQVVVVSFGYTYCPDICPFTFWKMTRLLSQLGDQGSDLAYVFVTVDPERDTPEKIAEYVAAFDPRFYGVHLEGEALTALTGAWEVTVRRIPYQNPANPDGSYNVDHTGTYFVIDRKGRVRFHFTPKATVEGMLPPIRALLEGGR